MTNTPTQANTDIFKNLLDFGKNLLDNDTLKCWGNNQYGALGLGDTDNRGLLPGHMGDLLPEVPLLNPTLAWNPHLITPLVWLDATTPSTLEIGVQGTDVHRWHSKALSSVFRAEQNTAASRPLRIADGLNSQPVVRFDGSDDHIAFVPAIPNTRSVAMIMRWNGSSSNGTLLGGYSHMNWQGGSGSFWYINHPAAPHTSVKDGSAYQMGLYYPPLSLQRTWNWQVIIFTTTSNVSIENIGSERNISGRFFDGELAELLIFNYVLNTSDRQRLEGYLAQRWGLAEGLPADHPYRAGPITIE